MCKSHLGGTGFEGMKESWRAAETLGTVRGHRRPLVKVQPQLQLMAQYLKESCLGAEACHHEERAYERLLVKPNYSRSQQCFGDASAIRWPPRTAAVVEYRQLEPRRQAVCYKGQSWKSDPSPWRSPEDHELDPRHWTIGVWVLLLVVTVPWCFPLEGRKYFSGAHS